VLVFEEEHRITAVNVHWRPSIFMPRWASRLTLEVVNVRVERLHSITEDDARAEGVDPAPVPECCGYPDRDGHGNPTCCGCPVPVPSFVEGYRFAWDEINGRRHGCAWADDPWVWVVEFRRATT